MFSLLLLATSELCRFCSNTLELTWTMVSFVFYIFFPSGRIWERRVSGNIGKRAADLSDIYRGVEEALWQTEGDPGTPELVLPGRHALLHVCVYAVSEAATGEVVIVLWNIAGCLL